MITLDHVTYAYPGDGAGRPALRDLSLSIDEGELALVVGPSGSGKSTFLRCLNGLIPHFYGGTLKGRIDVAGHDPVALSPQGMAFVVGMVFQDPETQFVTERVEDELAFGMENQALPPALMRKRVEEVLDQLTIAHLRDRHISTLSGGEKQRVAIASVLTLHPEVLVLDEPTSQLDPQSAEEVLVAIRRLNEDLGLTVILAEHRLERVVQFVDRVLWLPGSDDQALLDQPRSVLAQVPLAPPLVDLAKRQGWQPLPLTVKEARRFVPRSQRSAARSAAAEAATLLNTGQEQRGASSALCAEQVTFRYPDGNDAVHAVNLALQAGEVVALMGRNGSGKTTLIKLLAGLLKPAGGRVLVRRREPRASGAGGKKRLDSGDYLDTRDASTDQIVQVAGYVPQNPGVLLFKDTLLEELAFTRQGHQMPADEAADRRLLASLGLAAEAERYPRDLSTGQRQRAALAAILVADPQILLLDEPTRGLDYQQKEALVAILLDLRRQGRAVLLATHDVELVARCADRVVLMGDGEIVVAGPTRQVMTGSLVFTSQINKLYRDPAFLVVEDVPLSGHPEGESTHGIAIHPSQHRR
ncbi:MAG: energy-coupling factor ABC transporter ATP-binding protein [Anaerolineae bacterium]|nr:energy-coupling factor ABC transporter ATP-binding protein [Anaerolineae bacterium]